VGRNRFLGGKSNGALFLSETATLADVVDGEVFVLDDKTYEFDSNASVIAGNIAIDITGAPTSDVLADRIVVAVNANKPTVPIAAKKNPAGLDTATTSGVRFQADNPGAAGNVVFTTTMAQGTSAITGAGLLTGGENPGTQTLHRGTYVVDAVDILLGGCVIPTALQVVEEKLFEVQVRDSNGVVKGDLTDQFSILDNNKIQVDITGAPNIIAGDVLVWNAWE